MFSRTGIAEPKLDTGAMTALSSAYGTLATALTSANLTSAGCVRHVQASNDGPRGRTNGQRSCIRFVKLCRE